MIVGVIIPDRGDRLEFTEACLEMVENQTRKPDYISHVNFTPKGNGFDLTKRIREGFNDCKRYGCDVVFIMENDDYYSRDYIAHMLMNWTFDGRPEIYGANETIYYHLKKKQFRKLEHNSHASLMNTMISCSARINWGRDDEVFLDLHLWRDLKGKLFTPTKIISIGMKHGVGLCGGSGHTTMPFDKNDDRLNFLKENTGPMFRFYRSMSVKMSTGS